MDQTENVTMSDGITCYTALHLKESYSLGTYDTVTNHIFSDSKAGLMALSSYKISSSIVMQCRTSIQVLSTLNRMCLSWVPGHCEIAGNEVAGKLARDGLAAILYRTEPYISL
jgi:ribonuclease HI